MGNEFEANESIDKKIHIPTNVNEIITPHNKQQKRVKTNGNLSISLDGSDALNVSLISNLTDEPSSFNGEISWNIASSRKLRSG